MTSKTWKIIHKIKFSPLLSSFGIFIRGKRDGRVFVRSARGKHFLLRCGKTENLRADELSSDYVIVLHAPMGVFIKAFVRHAWEAFLFRQISFYILITHRNELDRKLRDEILLVKDLSRKETNFPAKFIEENHLMGERTGIFILSIGQFQLPSFII